MFFKCCGPTWKNNVRSISENRQTPINIKKMSYFGKYSILSFEEVTSHMDLCLIKVVPISPVKCRALCICLVLSFPIRNMHPFSFFFFFFPTVRVFGSIYAHMYYSLSRSNQRKAICVGTRRFTKSFSLVT